jgi:hypothetical protein
MLFPITFASTLPEEFLPEHCSKEGVGDRILSLKNDDWVGSTYMRERGLSFQVGLFLLVLPQYGLMAIDSGYRALQFT